MSASRGPIFRFGVIADVQYADADDGTSFDGSMKRHYRGSLDALRLAVEDWACSDPPIAFVAQLGDLLDGRCSQYADEALQTVLQPLQLLKDRPILHCIGNHGE